MPPGTQRANSPDAATVAPDRRARRRREATAIALTAVAIGINYLWNAHQLEATTACQVRYNAAFVGQLSTRAKIADEAAAAQLRADDANDALLSGFAKLAATAPTDPTRAQQSVTDRRSRALFARYTKLRAAARQAQLAAVRARKANPLPPIPDC